MIKIISGSKYDTSTAKYLGEYSYSNSRDFNYIIERLYRTKAGKYFLHGEGGPMSRYAESSGQNSWSGGEKILPMSREAAMEWAEKNLTGEEYEAIFGEVDEGGEKEQLNILIPADLKSKLWALAEAQKKTISEAAEEIIRKGLA